MANKEPEQRRRPKSQHTVEKIGGTSMSQFEAVYQNVIIGGAHQKDDWYSRIFVVSAYAGITNLLLEHKKNGEPGVYGFFAKSSEDSAWRTALEAVKAEMHRINSELFAEETELLEKADQFITMRVGDAYRVLDDLHRVCQHGHFELDNQLRTVREMLASLGEAHSAWNMSQLLKKRGINACFIDLSGWRGAESLSLDERIQATLASVDLSKELPIVTGYAHTEDGLMKTFDRGYSEMTFSRIAVVTRAREAIIHKEYHLSSADPRQVGEDKVVPIGRTNYDVADQLANLGMEAIHPRAAIGLRQNNIPLRVKNTFEPEHSGTLITAGYVSDTPRVEIIAGHEKVHAIEIFDQDMVGNMRTYDQTFNELLRRFHIASVSRIVNANTITHFVDSSLNNVKRLMRELETAFPQSELSEQQVAIVAAIGSDMQVPGMLAKAVTALAQANISVLSMQQSMRQVDMEFVIKRDDYREAVKALHACLIEPHNHGPAIAA